MLDVIFKEGDAEVAITALKRYEDDLSELYAEMRNLGLDPSRVGERHGRAQRLREHIKTQLAEERR